MENREMKKICLVLEMIAAAVSVNRSNGRTQLWWSLGTRVAVCPREFSRAVEVSTFLKRLRARIEQRRPSGCLGSATERSLECVSRAGWLAPSSSNAINNLRLRSASRSRRPVWFVFVSGDILADATVRGWLTTTTQNWANGGGAPTGGALSWNGVVHLDLAVMLNLAWFGVIAKLALLKSLIKQDSARRLLLTMLHFNITVLPFNSTRLPWLLFFQNYLYWGCNHNNN